MRYPANLPLALALVLAVAGSAAPMIRSHADDQHRAIPASATPGSVTVITPQRFPDGVPKLPPPIRIAASGAGHATTQVAVAQILLSAYRKAVAGAPASCHLPVSLLAAIGQVESGSLAGRTIDSHGRTAILGPVLDGTNGFAAIPDTDNGRWDGNKVWDRAVGPLQFIPSTWRTFGVDGNGDGVADPQNIYDAAATAAAYLCYGGRNLSDPPQLRSAVLAYNDSGAYQQLVLTYQKRFASYGLDNTATVVGLSLGAAGAPVAGQALTGAYTTPTGAPTTGPKHRAGGSRSTAAGARSSRTASGTRTRGPSGAGGGAGASSTPTQGPTANPTKPPKQGPSGTPTSSSTGSPTGSPSGDPSPSGEPTACPSSTASADPTASPSPSPAGSGTDTCPPCDTSGQPSATPSPDPSASPTAPATCQPLVTDPSPSAAP